jgi:D-arabinose 1-dehydrogenase-like Zn-dependent alcohol dehydrogenase
MMATMKAMVAKEPGGDFVLEEREVREPGPGQIRVKVEACGICHSDAYVREGYWPGIEYPRVPGHEVAGRVDAVGEGVEGFAHGDRVGVGWHGGHCFTCEPCRRGDFISCHNAQICGISYDGGYQEFMIAPREAVARIPESLDAAEAAPLLCAGITVYNALRNSPARAGDLVAVEGLGGLGHLGVQFARQMGFHVVALSRGSDKADLAEQLGAHHYVDTTVESPAEALQKLGGAKIVLETAPSADAASAVVDGLGVDGQLLVVGAFMEPMQVGALSLIPGRRSIRGWPSGTAPDSEDTLRFSVLSGVAPHIERFPLEKANEAYERMITNQARFRVVLDI